VARNVTVEVDGRRYDVRAWLPEAVGAPAASTKSRLSTTAAASAAAGPGRVRAEMQGTIIEVLVAVGDTVEVGRALCVLEAMKMENEVASDRAGTVTEVHASEGDNVGYGDVLFVIE